ncbi:MAG TPA: hypothetical protein VIL46_04965 [Gemmataceae bacterium]
MVWLVRVNVRNAGGGSLAGATVEFFDSTGGVYNTTPVFTGQTDSAGRAQVPLVTTVYRQTGSDPAQVVTESRNPFRVRVTYAGVVQERWDLSFDSDTTLADFAF